MKDLDLQVDGLMLKAELFDGVTTRDTRPAVLLIHGWESAQDRMFSLAEELSHAGCVCLTVDLRGHGKSEGDHRVCSRKEFLRDVVAAYDLLVAQTDVDRDLVFAIGSSFGGYLAALLTAERPIRGVALRVPADYRDEGFDTSLYEQRGQGEHTDWRSRPHAVDETAALRAIHSFTGPVLVVESELDELVPQATVASYGEAVAEQQNLTYVVMKAAPHSISRHPELQKEFARIVTSWLTSHNE